MSIQHVLAVVAVSDFQTSYAWYEQLLGRPATNVPMPGTLAEWRVTDAGWVQMTVDPERAGQSMLNFAVDDLEAQLADLRGRGLDPGEITTANKSVQLGGVSDPDGNVITFIGNFRETY